PSRPTPFPYTTLFRSGAARARRPDGIEAHVVAAGLARHPVGLDADRVREEHVGALPLLERIQEHGHPVVAEDRLAPSEMSPNRRDRKSTRLNSSHQIT